jgi:hypothetical protein
MDCSEAIQGLNPVQFWYASVSDTILETLGYDLTLWLSQGLCLLA